MPKSKQRIDRRLALRHRKHHPPGRKHKGPAEHHDPLAGAADAFREQIARISNILIRPRFQRKAPAK